MLGDEISLTMQNVEILLHLPRTGLLKARYEESETIWNKWLLTTRFQIGTISEAEKKFEFMFIYMYIDIYVDLYDI